MTLGAHAVLHSRRYPNILVTAGLHDPRVGFWEPAKLVARLRELKTDDNLLLLKTEMGAGHFSVTGRYACCVEFLCIYAACMCLMCQSLAHAMDPASKLADTHTAQVSWDKYVACAH